MDPEQRIAAALEQLAQAASRISDLADFYVRSKNQPADPIEVRWRARSLRDFSIAELKELELKLQRELAETTDESLSNSIGGELSMVEEEIERR